MLNVPDHSRAVLGFNRILGVVRAVQLDSVVADPVDKMLGVH
jgi:hypothetical protein